jgi:hypothetical protein
MADTFTPSLNLCKPEINQSAQTWGIKLNSDMDLIDTFAANAKAFQAGNDARIQQLINAAILAAFPRGCIIAWSGGAGTVPAGWLLCNGANGTPNLADRFILGNVGTRANWEIGGDFGHNSVTDAQGYHAHSGNTVGHVLTLAETPAHQHGGSTDGQGAHQHTVSAGRVNIGGWWVGGNQNTTLIETGIATDVQGNHAHNFATDWRGSDGAHWHGIVGDGSHQHNVTVSNVPPYFSLAYIMRA